MLRALPAVLAVMGQPLQRSGRLWALLALLLALASPSRTARPMPKLAEPDFTLYHTK